VTRHDSQGLPKIRKFRHLWAKSETYIAQISYTLRQAQ